MSRLKGHVKWFNVLRGFGFIIPDDGTGEVFAHYTHIEGEGYRSLYEGDRVQFGITNNPVNGRARMVTNIKAVR